MNEEQKNKDFIQIYRGHIDDLTELAGQNYTAYKVFQFLIKNMDGSNALCVSNVALQEILGYGKATICRAVKYLKENGWICVLKSGTSNVYIVNPEVAWTSYSNQKSYCKFQANVLLSSSENAEYLNNSNATTRFKTIDTDFIRTVQEKQQEFIDNAKKIKAM